MSVTTPYNDSSLKTLGESFSLSTMHASFIVPTISSFNAKKHALMTIMFIYLALRGLRKNYPNDNQRVD